MSPDLGGRRPSQTGRIRQRFRCTIRALVRCAYLSAARPNLVDRSHIDTCLDSRCTGNPTAPRPLHGLSKPDIDRPLWRARHAQRKIKQRSKAHSGSLRRAMIQIGSGGRMAGCAPLPPTRRISCSRRPGRRQGVVARQRDCAEPSANHNENKLLAGCR